MSAPTVTLARPALRFRSLPWIGAGFGAAAVLAVHAPAFFHRLLDGDEAIYGSIAALMNLGSPLFAEGGVDNKPPGILWIYAAGFGLFGRYQMQAVHAIALVAMAATCVLMFVIARSLAGDRAGLLAAVLYGILTGAGNPRLLAANTEIFMTLPLTASFLLMLRRRWLWSGVMMALAGAFKQVAAIEVLLLPAGLMLLAPRGSWLRATVMFGGGLAIGLAAWGGLLAATGSLAGFWRWTVQTLVGYASTNWLPDLLAIRARDSIVPFVACMIVIWVAAVWLALRWKTLGAGERMAVVWLVLSAAGSIAGGHWSWHYFIQMMAPLALLAAIAIDSALRSPRRKLVAVVATVGIALPAIYWTAFDVRADPLTYDWNGPLPQHETVAAYIRDHTKASDRVFVWGNWPALYVESDRLMASRFPGFLRGFARGSNLPPNSWDTAPDVWPALQADLERNPPALIVDTAAAGWSDFSKYPMSNYPVLAQLVADHYQRVATVDSVVIYARVS